MIKSNQLNQFTQLTVTTKRQYAEDVSNWLQLKGAVSITLCDSGDEPIYEPPLDETPLWQHINISALYDLKVNTHNLINQLNYDFSREVIDNYTTETVSYDLNSQQYNFDPICFADKFWIYPYNKHPEKQNNKIVYINLEPGLAFGSGEHPTTILCLEWLINNLNKDSTIIDYGCGSGILSLAAVKLGAKAALAVDIDPQAILATNENAQRNNIADHISTYFPNDLPNIQVDYLVANILASPLIELSSTLVSYLKPGGKLVLSGILEEQTDFVALSYMNCGITISEIKRKGSWIRIIGEKK
ncbi:MAG: 50S ribosomal protein L11 methyltransferase [Gammaproteobacteria bacterium]|nr:50S ribosomal protein L11 methyltransferase [Gammaproteobacteria bacterium]